MVVTLGKLDKVEPKEIWPLEASDFTPWLSENLGLLGESLGLDLDLIKVESAVGPFACDIEARETQSNRKVIIENQLGQTDHRHLGQLLTYAAGLQASVIVWISPDVRDEHREAIDFLNRYTIESIDFFAIELEVVRIGSSLPAVVFNLAASPNAWAKKVSAASRPTSVSNKMDSYRYFYQLLIDELRTKYNFTNAKIGQPQSWYGFASGTAGIIYMTSFTAKGALMVDLYIDVKETFKNKAVFDYLNSKKDLIESEFGAPLKWDRLDSKQACRIAIIRENSSIEDASVHGVEMRQWIVDNLLLMRKSFGPHLKMALQSALVSPISVAEAASIQEFPEEA